MTVTPIGSHALPTHTPDATGRRSPLNDDPIVLLLYGEEHMNLALADELALDGYEVRRASDTAKLRDNQTNELPATKRCMTRVRVRHSGPPLRM